MSESKQEAVVKLVEAGIHSREEIKDQIDCTTGSLASYFSGMRNAAKFTGAALCPIEEEVEIDGEIKKVMVCKTFAEVQAIKEERAASRTSKSASKSPEERLEAATKRLTRCESILDKFDDRVSSADGEISEELSLRFDKAKIEARLAEIELARCKELVATADDVEEDAEVEDGETAEGDEDLM